MESLCRLCCSTKFVNNYLFDEENALNLKMELFLPIKMMKGDQLPQKVCNRCSCKVNDLYQFCNIAIEAQDRLRSMLLRVDADFNESMDLSITKHEVQLPIVPEVIKTEQGTQTDEVVEPTKINTDFRPEVTLKVEPKSRTPSPIKRECSMESDCCDVPSNIPSDDSDNVSLIALKKKKRGRKANTNGELLIERAPAKRGRKKKPKLKDWELIMNALPEGTAVSVIQKPKDSAKSDIVKEEFIETECKIPEKPQKAIDVKKEPNDVDAYQCCICFTQCYSRSAMLQHYRQHASGAEAVGPPPPPPPPPQPMRCTRCRKPVGAGAGAWAAHWARHWERDRRPFRCALCEKTFRDAPQILKHGQTHAGGAGAGEAQPLNKRFICDLCPEGFVYMRYLLAHRSRTHTEAAARPLALRCAVCGRTFAHLNSLRRHLRAHSGERNYLCSVCGKALSSREHLKFHLRIHTGYKPNVCKTCGKGFVKKCNLTLHERVHSGEKPHVCSHCGKAFSQRSTLVIHERYHSGARPYACALCGRGFVAKGLLSMHLKSTCI